MKVIEIDRAICWLRVESVPLPPIEGRPPDQPETLWANARAFSIILDEDATKKALERRNNKFRSPGGLKLAP